MKMLMIAALVAAPLPAAAAPAQAAEAPLEASSAPKPVGDVVELDRAEAQAPAPAAENAPASARALAAQEDEPKKRKSTGDKVLTGAAVILGIAAVAVAGLLIAIAVN